MGVTSSIRPTRNPALANARMAACAPAPGVLAPEPPGARTLMWMAVIPLSLATVAACAAALIVAYADDSSLSDLTCIPPEERAIVSAPEMSVKWIIVLLYEL